jgi:dipeptidyl aminopeptidase/acylaminoacyl peptidase
VAKRLVVALAVALAAVWPALQGSTALSPPLLTYSIQVHLPDGPHDAGLCVARADGSRRVRLALSRGAGDASWSPDGRFVAYARKDDIFVANADGSGERNVTRDAALSSGPAWSPDGRRLAYTAFTAQGGSRIAVVDRVGTNRRVLNLRTPGSLSQPAWAPDGRQLAVTSSLPTPLGREVWVALIDGSGSRLLASGAAEPAWSPDGLRIAYTGAAGVVVVNSDGTGSRVVAPRAGSAAWSPDGRVIAFDRVGVLMTTRLDGGGERVLVRGPLPAHSPAWRPATAAVAGTQRPCIQTGTARADTIRGTHADEVILGAAGADTIFAGGGDDIVLGDSGDDFIAGEAGADRLVGGPGRDRLYGGRGDDAFFALDAQRDLLDGGPGRDLGSYDVGLTDGTLDRRRSVELSRP